MGKRDEVRPPADIVSYNLKTISSRSQLDPSDAPYWYNLDDGFSLGLRKGLRRDSWVARVLDPRLQETFGLAETKERLADGKMVLDFSQAKDKAIERCKAMLAKHQRAKNPTPINTVQPATPGKARVADAIDAKIEERRGMSLISFATDLARLNKIKREIGHFYLEDLTQSDIIGWRNSIVASAPQVRSKAGGTQNSRKGFDPTNPDHVRARQSTANRATSDLLGALRIAKNNGWVKTDDAWRDIKFFDCASGVRDAVLGPNEQTHFLNCCTPEFRPLAYGALVLGGRYGALIRLKVGDFRPLENVVKIGFDKHGRDRLLSMAGEALLVLTRITEGRKPEEFLFLRANGKRWGKSQQHRPMGDAKEKADIDITFYGLRHTFITRALLQGITPMIIAKATGTSLQMIEDHYEHLKSSAVPEAMDKASVPVASSEAEIQAVKDFWEAKRAEREVVVVERAFTLESLHPSSYLGKIKGGTVEAPPPPKRPTRDELVEHLLDMPASQIAKEYGVSGVSVAKWCAKHGLTPFGRGDWAKRHAAERAGRGALARAQWKVVLQKQLAAHQNKQCSTPA